jgi:pimeloyl-ACP methyl ester carboxylesterase
MKSVNEPAKDEEAGMATVRTRAGAIAYEVRGEGDPVVLLHANLHDRHDYDGVVERLAPAYRTIAVDWPGHGESGRPESGAAITAPLLAGALADFVAALELGPAVYVGNSVGGYAAARLAVDRPERVAGLVLVNSGGFVKPTVATSVGARLLGTPGINRRIMPRLVPRYMSPRGELDARITTEVRQRAATREGAEVCAGLWRSFGDPAFDLRAVAGRITAPTLLAWGLRDVVLPPSTAEQTHAALAGATLHRFDTGHVVFASDPAGFVGALRPFLGSVYERSRA